MAISTEDFSINYIDPRRRTRTTTVHSYERGLIRAARIVKDGNILLGVTYNGSWTPAGILLGTLVKRGLL